MNFTGKIIIFLIIFCNLTCLSEDIWSKKERLEEIYSFYSEHKEKKYSEIKKLRFVITRLKRNLALNQNIIADNYIDKAEFLIMRIEFKELSLDREIKKIKNDIDNFAYSLSINIEKLKVKLKYSDFVKKYNNISELFENRLFVKCSKLLSESKKELDNIILNKE
ncbi:MAG: hypothetical protein M0R46_01170 [Candidatus Muirbacterium halophilum]|nr:hypothetical protein [Candidatus Muirbacterium halophilum]MCK9474506.1 hypothetical protein [Candidatus Muirbacterium halophilum]